MTTDLPWPLWAALGACVAALLSTVYALAPGPARIPLSRRRPHVTDPTGALTGATAAATSLIDGVLRRRDLSQRLEATLQRAGVKARLQDAVLLAGVGVVVAGAFGLVVGGPVAGFLLALLVPVLVKVMLGLRTGKRERRFADQLDDSLQLVASSLRAGHSLMQAFAAVAAEAEEPTSEEFGRILNETRVGRELAFSLDEAGRRMKSEDFVWVTQAIAINREVGGNLAEVLDGVSDTIRERNQIRRQVKALAAEGKLSAIVLMLLPFGTSGFLMLSNPGYILRFTESFLGYGMLAVAFVLLVVGALWLRKSVQVTF